MKKKFLLFLLVFISLKTFAQMDMSSMQNMLQSGGLDQLLQSKGIGGDDIQKLKGMASQYGIGNNAQPKTTNSTIVTGTPADSFANRQNQNQNFNNYQNNNSNQPNSINNLLNNYQQNPNYSVSATEFYKVLGSLIRENDSLKGFQAKRLKSIYGLDYFNAASLAVFDRTTGAKAPDSYLLDEGDELNISVWGYSEYNEVFKIDNEGYIQPQNIGRIYLKGLTFKDARDLITKKFGGVYDLNNSKIGIKLIYSRVIRINIVGEVNRPGTYAMSAINTAFNALTAALGPDSIASLRNIQIKREGKVVKTLDLYEFLMNPDSKEEYFLRDNDYIVVNPYDQHVSIAGQVKRPMIYEIKKGEMITDLIKFAGGLKASAFTKNITVKHFQDNHLTLINVDWDAIQKSKTANLVLSDGDNIYVSSIDSEIVNQVELAGAVRVPGKYEVKENETRVADVIKKSGGILYSTYSNKAYITRMDESLHKTYLHFNVDSVLNFPNIASNHYLKPLDKIEIFSKHRFEDSIKIKISGAVRKPGYYTFGGNLTLKDVLYYAGGLKAEAAGNRIEVARIINYNESTKQGEATKIAIKTIKVNTDLKIDEVSEQFEMQPYDEVFVRSIPEFDYNKDIVLTGEVKYPGVYSLISKNEKLMDVIKRAGGLLPTAFHQGVMIKRTTNEIGDVVVDIDKAIRRPNSQFNYLLRENDSIYIPKINELVTIAGAFNFVGDKNDTTAQISVPYFAGKRAGYYIKDFAGGFSKDAFKRKVVSIEANGRVRGTRKFLGLINRYPKVKMGAKIVVPKKAPETLVQNGQGFDWNRAFDSFTIRLTGLVTIFVLASKAVDVIKN